VAEEKDIMKLITVIRKTRPESRYSKKMGVLLTKVTYIKKAILGIPVKTLYSYRMTYYGKIKECKNCSLAK